MLMPNGKPYDHCPVCGDPGELAYIVAEREIRWYSTVAGAKNHVLVKAENGDVGLYSWYCRKCGWMSFYCPPEALAATEEVRATLLRVETVDFADGRLTRHPSDRKGLARPPGR